MFGQPFVLRQLGGSGVFTSTATMDVVISLLLVVGIAALAYAVSLLAKAPDRAPRVHVKPEHRRRRRRRTASS